MSRTRTLVALLCAAVAAMAPAAAQAAVTTTTIDYGPYTIPAGNGDPHDHMGMGMIPNTVVGNVAKPCSGCTLIKIKPDLVYTNGTKANIADGPMLHHTLIAASGGGKADATCAGTTVGTLGERFFAAGNERTTMDVSSVPYGYKIGTSESWNMVYELMNWQTTSKTVKIRMTYTYATGSDATARAALRPVWLDVAQCSMTSHISVPNGISDTHYDWTVNVPGKLIHAAGHIHDHGVNVELTNQSTGGTSLCNSVATAGGTPDYVTPDGRGHISSMTTCLGNPISTLASNQQLRLHVNYNVPATHMAIDDAMGIMIAYINPS